MEQMKMEKTQNYWSEKEEAKLIELYKQGLTDFEICEQLNRGKPSVSHRIQLLKERQLILSKRRISSNKDSYFSAANKIIENFYNKGMRTRHKGSDRHILEENWQLIKAMDERNITDNLTENTRSNYIRHLLDWGRYLDKRSWFKVELKDVEEYFRFLQTKYKSQNSIQGHRSAIKGFYQFLAEKYGQENIRDIWTFLNRKKRGKVRIAAAQDKEHLTRQEVVKLVSAIRGNSLESIRNRALIACMYDTGSRINELLAVLQQHTKYNDAVPRLWLPISKTQPRYSHMLKFSLPYLMEWIKVHEFWQDENAPLFYSMSSSNYGDSLKAGMAGMVLRRALRISGIKKKISCHSLRHTKAFHSAEEGMMVSEANKLFGWSKTSGMFHYYSQVSEKELEMKEQERAGKLTPEQLTERKNERNAFVMKHCLRCHHETTPDQLICGNCGLALNKQVAEQQMYEVKITKQDMAKQMQELFTEFLHQKGFADKLQELRNKT